MNTFRIELDDNDWKAGYIAGYERKPYPPPLGVDGLSWASGYLDGKIDREHERENRCRMAVEKYIKQPENRRGGMNENHGKF